MQLLMSKVLYAFRIHIYISDLLSIGSYTELPGGNIPLPRGFSSILQPIVASIPQDNILKGHPVKQINWKYRVEMENMKSDIGYESSDGDDSNASIKTVESVSRKGDNLESHVPPLTPSLRQFSRRSTAANSLLSTAQVRFKRVLHFTQKLYL